MFCFFHQKAADQKERCRALANRLDARIYKLCCVIKVNLLGTIGKRW